MFRNYKIYLLITIIISFIIPLIFTACDGGLDDLGVTPGSSKSKTKARPGDYENVIAFYAKKNKLPVNLVSAVIEVESDWDEDAVSPAGAEGLMQLMPGTASMLGVKNSFEPAQNIAGGTKYLRMLLDEFNGNYKLALAAYNAGPKSVEKYKGIPPYAETIHYVNRVMAIYKSH